MAHKEATVREVLQAVAPGREPFCTIQQNLINKTLSKKARQQLRVGCSLPAGIQGITAILLACRQIEAFHRQRVPKSWVQFGMMR